MRALDDVTLLPLGPDKDGLLRARVMRGGHDSGLVVEGEDLNVALSIDDHLLLFVSYGDPYEDSLAIYLAEENGRILDQAVLAASGVSGQFSHLELVPPSRVRFSFFAQRPWQIEVFEHGRIAPSLSTGLGVWRPMQWKRWFSLAPV